MKRSNMENLERTTRVVAWKIWRGQEEEKHGKSGEGKDRSNMENLERTRRKVTWKIWRGQGKE